MQWPKDLKSYGIYLAFVLTCCILAALSPQFLTVSNWTIIISQVSINGILAFGLTFVIITGGIDLSVGSIVAVSGVVAALFASKEASPVILGVFMGLFTGFVLGLLNGLIITKSKIVPFIVTLGFMTIGRGLALILSKGRPISGLSPSFNHLGNGHVFGIQIAILILFAVLILSHVLLSKTVFGRYVYAIGGNEEASRASGINVTKIKIIVYSICGLLAGLAGVMLTAKITTGQPNAGQGFELDAIAACIIGGASTTGGVGSIKGTLLGVLLIGVINNGLDLMNVSSYFQQVIMGLIIIAAVMLDSWKLKKQ
jgi:ribose/xylose/arabinose/galactoside ABC-type transport system permease subunit